MADGDFQSSQQSGQGERFRGQRGPREGGNREGGGNREAGGFRIRLSDNEMRAARAVQEAFGLRSTVAALGLSIRTVAQLLEEGKLDEVLAQHRDSGTGRPPRERRDGGRDGGREGGRGERNERGNRPNPFARPARPVAVVQAADAEASQGSEALTAEAVVPDTAAADTTVADTEAAANGAEAEAVVASAEQA